MNDLHVVGFDKFKLHFELHDRLGKILGENGAGLWVEWCVFKFFGGFLFRVLFVFLEEVEEAHLMDGKQENK